MRLLAIWAAAWFALIGATDASAQTPRNYFAELAYVEPNATGIRGASPEAVCASLANAWGWNVNGYNMQVEQDLPGRWRCQRYYNGVKEPSWYTWILGVCQVNPAPLRTGSNWAHPYWDEAVGDCYCSAPRLFDATIEWCDSVPPAPPIHRDDTCTEGNPVQPGTGTKTHKEADYLGGGAHPLEISRFYRSDSVAASSIADLEVGWMHSFQARLIFNPYGNGNPVVVVRPDATIRRFTTTSTATPRTWQGDVGTLDALVEVRDVSGVLTGWQYRTTDNSIEDYDLTGRLQTIKARNGWTHALTYSTATTPAAVAPQPGLLIGVRNHFGRELKFVYDSQSRLVELLPPGAVAGSVAGSATSPIRYVHDEPTSLGSGVPARGQLTSVIWQDGHARRYHYEDARFPAALTGITDELGVRYATYAYDSYRRVQSEQHAGGVDRLDFAYSANQTTVTDYSTGTPSSRTYTFTNQGGVLRPTAVSAPCTLCGNTALATTYDASGKKTKEIAHDDTVTFYAYDAKGRETERATFPSSYQSATTRPALGAASQVVSTKWHATFNLTTGIAEPGKVWAHTYNAKGMLTGQSWTATTDTTGAAKFNATRVGSTFATGWGYNANSLATSIVTKETPAGGSGVETGRWTYAYDALGDRTREVNRFSGMTHRAFDFTADGHVLEGIDEQNVRYRYVRDARGQVREHHYGVPTARQAAVTGGLTNLSEGYVAKHIYDGAGRLTSTTRTNSAPVSIAYSAVGVVTGVSVGAPNAPNLAAAVALSALPAIGGSGLFLCNRGTTILPVQLGNHAYLWDVVSQRCCGRAQNQDPLLSCSEPGPPTHACTFVEGSVGKEKGIMSCCQQDANAGDWRPWRNDQCSSCWLTPGADLPPLPTVP